MFPAAFHFFVFAKSLNIRFTNTIFNLEKPNFNLQIFIVNPILAGLYLFINGWEGDRGESMGWWKVGGIKGIVGARGHQWDGGRGYQGDGGS